MYKSVAITTIKCMLTAVCVIDLEHIISKPDLLNVLLLKLA